MSLGTTVDAALTRLLPLLSTTGLAGLAFLAAFLGLFIAHQLAIWWDVSSVSGFERSRTAVSVLAEVWDVVADLYNPFTEVYLELVPMWNFRVQHLTEPLVYAALDVLTVTFSGRAYEGVISEEALPYRGFRCDTSEQAMAWCGDARHYAAALGMPTGKPAFEATELVIEPARMRALSESALAPLIGVLPIDAILDGLHALLASYIVVYSFVWDVGIFVAHTVLVELFGVLVDLFVWAMQALAELMLMVVRSGLFSAIVGWGLDLLVALVVEVALPLMLACVSALLCVVDFLTPLVTWEEQLVCVSASCFRGDSSDTLADVFLTFLSIAPAAEAVQAVYDHLFNERTGVRYANGTAGAVSDDVPALLFDGVRSARQAKCADCFVCKVPELRALWLLVAMTYGCVLDALPYRGRVEEVCMVGGRGYVDMCGPRGAAQFALTEREFRETYTVHLHFDAEHAQSFASRLETLAREQGGAGANGFTAKLLEIGFVLAILQIVDVVISTRDLGLLWPIGLLMGLIVVVKAVLALLQSDLSRILTLLDPEASAFLQGVRIWVEHDFADWGGAVYHPSAVWLEDNGYPTHWAESMQIGSTADYLSWTAIQPAIVLHELSHAWHHQYVGYDDASILQAYDAAMASGIYDSVPYAGGGKSTAYATSNVQEYFAELTEAWFWENDFYPFVREELEDFDPTGAAMVEAAWQP